MNPLVSHCSSSSPTQPPARKLHSHLIPHTPRNLQPILSLLQSSIPPPSPETSVSRPVLDSPMKPSRSPQPKPSPVKEEDLSPLFHSPMLKYFKIGSIGQ
ncbi:hypothetical protein O181_100979 [Austropuccinia psidii MF-1]|uniref:Uncharacterized protein n=1 Tax=Austropuccinia psidii MF-1 TaxID=1389203 RepID=A0A9Q3JGA4_9BASI|nr:hypothetical protein [Austropuccinia psidii MF-1]